MIITFHGTDIQKDPALGYGLRLDRRQEARIRHAVNGADALVAISATVRQAALELVQRSERIFDIPNGVDLQRFSMPMVKGTFRRRLGIDDRAPVLLAVGRNHPKKGFEYLMEAMRHVAAAYPSARCIILGRGAETLRNLACSLGVEKHVLLTSEIGAEPKASTPLAFPGDEVIAAYRDSDIFVSPSLLEGCSLAVLEAMAAGLAVVVADAPGNRDAIEDGYNGLTCHPRDPIDLSAKLMMLMADAPLRQRLAHAARESVRRYDWPEVAARYVDAYQQIAHSGRAAQTP